MVVGAALTGSSRFQQQVSGDWLRRNGDDWRRMEPNARLAYVEGFLAGAALSQAAAGARDTAAVRVALEELSSGGRFRFPFLASVLIAPYACRIDEGLEWRAWSSTSSTEASGSYSSLIDLETTKRS